MLQNYSLSGKLPLFTKWGKWWHKDKEIDIVALNELSTDIMFCECKWQNKMVGKNLLMDLMETSGHVIWKNQKRFDHYVIVSRSGFTKPALRFAEDHNIHLLSFNDLVLSIDT